MPRKKSHAARHPCFRVKYRIQNWPEYEARLTRRGDLTLWLDEAAIAGWAAPRRTTPGGQARYAGLAIEFVLTLRPVFQLALRQAEGLVSSVLRLLGLNLPVPDHTTLSRRSREFAGRKGQIVSRGPLHLVIESSGLKIFGRGEWQSGIHDRSRRTWHKLHIGVDAVTGEIIASVLTGNDVHDASQVPALLEQIQGEIATVTADGAYDGEPIYRAMQDRQLSPVPTIIIPPRAGAAITAGANPVLRQRDGRITLIQEQGRAAWHKMTGHGKRSLGETAIGRYKALIGPQLRARSFPNQQGEVALAGEVLNRMIQTCNPVSVRVA